MKSAGRRHLALALLLASTGCREPEFVRATDDFGGSLDVALLNGVLADSSHAAIQLTKDERLGFTAVTSSGRAIRGDAYPALIHLAGSGFFLISDDDRDAWSMELWRLRLSPDDFARLQRIRTAVLAELPRRTADVLAQRREAEKAMGVSPPREPMDVDLRFLWIDDFSSGGAPGVQVAVEHRTRLRTPTDGGADEESLEVRRVVWLWRGRDADSLEFVSMHWVSGG